MPLSPETVGRAKAQSAMPAETSDGGHASLCPPYDCHFNFSPTTRTKPSGTALKPSTFVVCAINTLR